MYLWHEIECSKNLEGAINVNIKYGWAALDLNSMIFKLFTPFAIQYDMSLINNKHYVHSFSMFSIVIFASRRCCLIFRCCYKSDHFQINCCKKKSVCLIKGLDYLLASLCSRFCREGGGKRNPDRSILLFGLDDTSSFFFFF